MRTFLVVVEAGPSSPLAGIFIETCDLAERLLVERDNAEGALRAMAALLGLAEPLPSWDEVCAVALDRINQARCLHPIVRAVPGADGKFVCDACRAPMAATGDVIFNPGGW